MTIFASYNWSLCYNGAIGRWQTREEWEKWVLAERECRAKEEGK